MNVNDRVYDNQFGKGTVVVSGKNRCSSLNSFSKVYFDKYGIRDVHDNQLDILESGVIEPYIYNEAHICPRRSGKTYKLATTAVKMADNNFKVLVLCPNENIKKEFWNQVKEKYPNCDNSLSDNPSFFLYKF